MEIPNYGIYANEDWPSVKKGAAAMISKMDHDVGKILKLLQELELDKKTFVFFTSDNGPHLKEVINMKPLILMVQLRVLQARPLRREE